MIQNLIKKLSGVSTKPGVYIFKDNESKVLYVGKARNLKKRLSTYITKQKQSDIKTQVLITKIKSFETIITKTEQEALILESNLIKKYRPRYNVLLKDGKRYPSLYLDTLHPLPNLTIVRKTYKKKGIYFGPFTSGRAVKQTMKIIEKTFKLRKCKNRDFTTRTRPCLNFQIDACLAPCCNDIDREEYHALVKEVVLFLKGRTPELIKKTKKDMEEASGKMEFEKAASLRDKLFALERILEKQIVVTNDFIDRDIIGQARSSDSSVITILFIRGGHLLGNRHFSFSEIVIPDLELMETFIKQYYEKTPFIPKEVLLPLELESTKLFEDWLETVKGKKVRIAMPLRGKKAQLVKMATQNAQNELESILSTDAAKENLIKKLQKCLRMEKLPQRIECFDNSNISGSSPVAGMVVFKNGKPDKSEYRKFKIKSVKICDDYAYMAEVMKRRYGRGKDSKPYPQLLMLDGGKGQLNIALSVINDLNLPEKFEVIAIAKKNKAQGEKYDKIYKEGRANPVNLGKGRELLFFLQQIRDETHRFTISFHRQRRGKSSIRSVLDNIPGIGVKRKKSLLKHFGTIKKIGSATTDELRLVPGMNKKAAMAVLEKLNNTHL